jgi:hypothetical protein
MDYNTSVTEGTHGGPRIMVENILIVEGFDDVAYILATQGANSRAIGVSIL